MNFSYLLIFFALAITIHMVEEVIWLPAWSETAGRWHPVVTSKVFLLATAVFLAFVYAITFLARQSRTPGVGLYLALGTAVLMLFNIIIPHLGATIAQRRYAPGLLTAIVFILPTMAAFIYYAFQNFDLKSIPILSAALLMILAAVFLWPLLFKVGDRLFGS